GEVRPGCVYLENSPLLVGRGLAMVLGHLTEMGYDARWGVVGAHHLSAFHKRDRIWVVADASGGRCRGSQGREVEQPRRAEVERGGEAMANAYGISRNQGRAHNAAQGTRGRHAHRGRISSDVSPPQSERRAETRELRRDQSPERSASGDPFGRSWPSEPGMGRVANGVAHRVDRITALGNGQVPRVAAAAFHLLSQRI